MPTPTASDVLDCGSIVYLHIPHITPPASKFAVIGCIDPKLILFLINSELTEFKQSKPDLMAGQLIVPVAEHPCLRYDSWLDCAEPHGYDRHALNVSWANDRGIKKGTISPVLRSQILSVVQTSRTIPKKQIDMILAALS
jgi:hypothetical protein